MSIEKSLVFLICMISWSLCRLTSNEKLIYALLEKTFILSKLILRLTFQVIRCENQKSIRTYFFSKLGWGKQAWRERKFVSGKLRWSKLFLLLLSSGNVLKILKNINSGITFRYCQYNRKLYILRLQWTMSFFTKKQPSPRLSFQLAICLPEIFL